MRFPSREGGSHTSNEVYKKVSRRQPFVRALGEHTAVTTESDASSDSVTHRGAEAPQTGGLGTLGIPATAPEKQPHRDRRGQRETDRERKTMYLEVLLTGLAGWR